MTDQSLNDDAGEDVELEATPRKGGMPGKKIVLFVVLPLLLLIGAAAGLYLSGVMDSLFGGEVETQETASRDTGPSVYHDMPTMLVNLSSSGQGNSFLKLQVALELSDEAAKERIEAVMPRVVDNFQVYLRELRIEDLQGSAGLQRLREELLLRVNTAVADVEVRDVLFKEMLVQ